MFTLCLCLYTLLIGLGLVLLFCLQLIGFEFALFGFDVNVLLNVACVGLLFKFVCLIVGGLLYGCFSCWFCYFVGLLTFWFIALGCCLCRWLLGFGFDLVNFFVFFVGWWLLMVVLVVLNLLCAVWTLWVCLFLRVDLLCGLTAYYVCVSWLLIIYWFVFLILFCFVICMFISWMV